MTNGGVEPGRRRIGPRRFLVVALLVLPVAACDARDDDASTPAAGDAAGESVQFVDQTGPHVDDPDRAMAMTVDAVEVAGDDILVRIRVENDENGYLDLGVQDTFYGPLLVMHDDRGNLYESYAVEPAGIPGRRVADLSFRLVGPLDPDATSFTLELVTDRGPLVSPSGPLPDLAGKRWRVDGPSADAPTSDDADSYASEPVFAAAPRLPHLIHFWLETEPLPAQR